jgi:peptidoglycan/xylan/chitin deacetylase (PgdA/CDA1 family)
MTGTVALTYDDGPDRVWTPRVLEALRRFGARATFFVQARRAADQRELLAEMVADGHEIGFHCLDHVRHSQRTPDAVAADVGLGLDILDDLRVRPRAWRAPWGVETDATRSLAAARELRLWGWNIDTHDWRGDPAARMLGALEAQGGLRPGDVILMHDALGPGARREGCAETVALTELLLAAAERLRLETVNVSSPAGAPA